MNKPAITLTRSEVFHAAVAGVERQVENIFLGRKPAFGAGTYDDWNKHVQGCLGELAFSKWANLYWPCKGKFREADVDRWQIRTGGEHHYRLMLHPKPDEPHGKEGVKGDENEDLFWLVTGDRTSFVIHGCILGKDGKKERYWEDPSRKGRPAYFVPQEAMVFPDWAKNPDAGPRMGIDTESQEM